MKVIRTYVGNTAASIIDTIEDVDENGRAEPMQLAGTVERVTLLGLADGQPITPRDATPLETADPATYGRVRVTPDPADIAAPRSVTAWWRVTLLGGGIIDTPEFEWVVAPHGVAADTTADLVGVCSPWATNGDVIAYAGAEQDDGIDYTQWLAEASELLYVLTGRRFPGDCVMTVRPCLAGCGHWQVLARGHVVTLDPWWGGGWGGPIGWGCGRAPTVTLAGHARRIESVTFGGVTVDPATYRLDRNRDLVRLTDPATGQNPGWPLCQDVALPEGAPGTFSIRYRWGASLPIAGRRAAAMLAWQLYLSDTRSGKCKLPAGWTNLTRQGVSIARAKPPEGGTGILGIDTFIAAANPYGHDRPPAVYSPDVPGYPRRVG